MKLEHSTQAYGLGSDLSARGAVEDYSIKVDDYGNLSITDFSNISDLPYTEILTRRSESHKKRKLNLMPQKMELTEKENYNLNHIRKRLHDLYQQDTSVQKDVEEKLISAGDSLRSLRAALSASENSPSISWNVLEPKVAQSWSQLKEALSLAELSFNGRA
jgi:hypothetical protein